MLYFVAAPTDSPKSVRNRCVIIIERVNVASLSNFDYALSVS